MSNHTDMTNEEVYAWYKSQPDLYVVWLKNVSPDRCNEFLAFARNRMDNFIAEIETKVVGN